MATQPEVVNQSDLLNQLVIDRNTMAELGRVDVLWMHPPVHRVLGFICKSGFLGNKKTAFNLAQIKTLGGNSILVNAKPVETDSEKVRQLESLINCEVWSDAGNKIGRITDCLFNFKSGVITQYLFVPSGLGMNLLQRSNAYASGIYLLPPSKILSFGNKRVLVSEAAAQNLAVYSEGIKQKLTKAGNFLKEDYIQATQEVRSLAKQAQAATEQAKERVQALAEQAKDRVQTLNEQLKEETQTLAKLAQEKGQSLVEQVKTQTTGEQVKEGTQMAQVKEKLDPVTERNSNIPPTSSPSTSKVTETTPTTLEDDDEPWI